MQTKVLGPLRPDVKAEDALQKEIEKVFREMIYLPLMEEVTSASGDGKIKNDMNILLEAIQEGRITFYRGKFKGKFNARISRELRRIGAKHDKKTKAYHISMSRLPLEVRMAVSSSVDRFDRTIDKIKAKLEQMLPEKIADNVKSQKIYSSVIFKANAEIAESIKGVSIAPTLTEYMREKITDEYSTNLELYIKEWTEGEILKLREMVKKETFQGFRYESLAKKINQRYGVSKSKAKFLARQETNLLLSKFRKSRYTEAGVNEYIWTNVVGSVKHPVRPMHKKLDGQIFSWDDPPITDIKGHKNHPGEDFNCRCYARPVVRF